MTTNNQPEASGSRPRQPVPVQDLDPDAFLSDGEQGYLPGKVNNFGLYMYSLRMFRK